MNGNPAIVQIVPRLGAQSDGVADYAMALARALVSEGIDSNFLCCESLVDADKQTEGLRVASVSPRSAEGLCESLRDFAGQTLLLHFVNYGYAARGCPFWLIDGLKAWKRIDPRFRLVTMFHELYASGPPWRSSFWLSPLQRHLSRELFAISNATVTNREQSRRWLSSRTYQSASRVLVMPVFSTFGELQGSVDWDERPRRIVVAGRSGAPQRAYGRYRERLAYACHELGIEEIADIGARDSAVPEQIGGIRVSAMGHLSQAQAGAVLSGARAGFLDYPSDYLGKSTVFAAYAAHGLVPVVSWHRGEEEVGLKDGVNYWIPRSRESAPLNFETIARQAHTWYADHRIEIQANEYARLLRGVLR